MIFRRFKRDLQLPPAPATPPDLLERSEDTINPYMAARREWNERYGDQIKQRDAWRLAALGAILVAALAVGGLISATLRSHIQPYIVELDRLGGAVAVGTVEPADDSQLRRATRAYLARFVVASRSVYTDYGAQRDLIKEAYALLDQASPAAAALNEFYRTASPFKRAEREIVAVNVKSVSELGGSTWRVEWTEKTTVRASMQPEEKEWVATITTDLRPPLTEQVVRINPFGIYVVRLDWSQRL